MKIKKTEVLRYLTYKNNSIDKQIENIIDECIEYIEKYSKYKYTYKVFNLNIGGKNIELENTNLNLEGKDIKSHLQNCNKCALIAVTLGVGIEKKIKYYQSTDITKAVILDACATAFVEEICDSIQKLLQDYGEKHNLNITQRYSPGYGDFPIEVQNKILNILNANRIIGLTCTEDYILIPRKSITAVIGFTSKNMKHSNLGCSLCNKYKTCEYRKE